MHLRFKTDARLAANIQRANTFRAVCLVSAEAHQIDLELAQINVNLAGCLCRIDVEYHTLLAANFTEFGDRLNDAHFVIDEHHRSQNRIRANRCLENLDIEQTIFLNIKIGRFKTLAFQLTHGVKHRFMLGFYRDDVLAFGAGVKIGRTFDGEVIGFGSAGRPENFLGIGTHQISDLLTRLFNRRVSHPAEAVRA